MSFQNHYRKAFFARKITGQGPCQCSLWNRDKLRRRDNNVEQQ